MHQFNQVALDVFKRCFPSPLNDQEVIGQPPASYIPILKECLPGHQSMDCRSSPIRPLLATYPNTAGQLSRSALRNLCNDPKVDVLEAYAALMAWGGQHRRWFRASLNHHQQLRDLLCWLRGSRRCRYSCDFAGTQQRCQSITGLGISYFTKVLHFFRGANDAYILDQWTAKSINLLLPGTVPMSRWGGPDQKTTPGEYEAYCAAVEALKHVMGSGWTGEMIERALFDRRGGCWRKWVKAQYWKGASKGANVPAGRTQNNQVKAKRFQAATTFQQILADVHTNFSDGSANPLPPGDIGKSNYRGKAIRLSSKQDVVWQYTFAQRWTTAILFVGKKAKVPPVSLQQMLPAALPKLGLTINRGNTTFASVRVSRAAALSDRAHAEAVVEAMAELWEVVHSVATSLGIQHPGL